MVCKMATSCYGRISESGNRVTFVISAVRRTSAHQTLENGSTAEPLRHRQTKGAGTDMPIDFQIDFVKMPGRIRFRYETAIPRSASRSSTPRKFRVNQKYSQIAC